MADSAVPSWKSRAVQAWHEEKVQIERREAEAKAVATSGEPSAPAASSWKDRAIQAWKVEEAAIERGERPARRRGIAVEASRPAPAPAPAAPVEIVYPEGVVGVDQLHTMLGCDSRDPNVIGVMKSREIQRLERVVEQAAARGMIKAVSVQGADGSEVASAYRKEDIRRFMQALGL